MKKTETAKSIQEVKDRLFEATIRAEFLGELEETAASKMHWYMDKHELTPTRTEEYTDEDGQTKTRYIWATYETDENGETLYFPPAEDDDYNGPRYRAWLDILAALREMAGALC